KRGHPSPFSRTTEGSRKRGKVMKKTKKMSVLTPVESAGRHYTRLGVDFIELIGFYEKYMSYLSDMAYVCHCLVTFPEYAGADFPPTRETVHKWAAEYDEYEKNNPESVCGTMEEEEAHRASHPTSGTIVPDDFGAKFFNANILEEIRNIDIRKGDSFMAVFTKCYFLHDRLASIYWNREYPVSTMEAANIIPFCGAVAEKTAELIGYWTAKRETRNPGAEKMKEKSAKTFANFCKQHKIAEESIKWRTTSDRLVKISLSKSDFKAGKSGGWNLVSVAMMFALHELGAKLDVTMRENEQDIEIVVEK
ncbi:MAG: hypothetical protein WCQ26_13655, partial [Pseudanabaena sp. ELA748]